MQTIALKIPLFGLIFALLVIFGFAYNWLTAHLERQGNERGYVSFLVVGGVAITVALSSFVIGMTNALIVAAFFVASGLPMIIGSMMRYAKSRKRDEQTARDLAREALTNDPSGAAGRE